MSISLSAQRLDFSTASFPKALNVRGLDRRHDLVRFIHTRVAQWEASGKISDPKQGFGFATTGVVPLNSLLEANPKNPKYIKAAFIDGRVPERHALNAACKIYNLLRLIQADNNANNTTSWESLLLNGAVIRKKLVTSAIQGKSLTMAVITAFDIWTQEENNEAAEQAAEWLLRVAT